MVNSRCGDSNSSVASGDPDSGPLIQENCSLIRSERPSFCDFEEIFWCAEEGHFKGQISSKWINSAKFRAFSRPLFTKMSVFSPKSRDERGIFPEDSLLFAPIPPGEGCKSSIRGREEIRVRPNGGIVVRQAGRTSFSPKNIEKMPNRASKIWQKISAGGPELCSNFAAENDLLSIPTLFAFLEIDHSVCKTQSNFCCMRKISYFSWDSTTRALKGRQSEKENNFTLFSSLQNDESGSL